MITVFLILTFIVLGGAGAIMLIGCAEPADTARAKAAQSEPVLSERVPEAA